MDRPALDLHFAGIRCDNPDCDFVDRTAKAGDESWIDRPCPKCGWNLLTREDHELAKKLQADIKALNKAVGDGTLVIDKNSKLFKGAEGIDDIKDGRTDGTAYMEFTPHNGEIKVSKIKIINEEKDN